MRFFRNKKYEPFAQFLLLWSILFVTLESWSEIVKYSLRALIALPVSMTVIALTVIGHYYLLFDRFAVNRKYKRYLMLLAGYIFLAILIDWGVSTLLSAFGLWGIEDGLTYPFIVSAQRVLVADTPMAFVYAAVRHFYKTKRLQAMLEAENHKNEMLLQRSRIEPAFINAAITALQTTAERESAPQTAAYLCELRELFRYSAEEASKENITMTDELAFTDRYVQMQKIRIAGGTHVTVAYHAKADGSQADIAPMLILPFIENAFKYGISYERPSRITISINVNAQSMELHVENTDHSDKSHAHSTGTGLANTIKRMELQYKNKYSLEQTAKNGLYAVSLKLDLS